MVYRICPYCGRAMSTTIDLCSCCLKWVNNSASIDVEETEED